MKKSFPANINGKIYYIDNDAYELLNSYLEELRQTFDEAERKEIMDDIECRISELFDERIGNGANAIVLADVNNLIERMGRPEDLSDTTDDETMPQNKESKTDDENPPFITFNLPARKKLFRNPDDKVFGGVFGGLASYLGWDATAMRIAYTVLTVLTYVWPFVVIYIVSWMIIPLANTPRRRLEMNGESVTVDSLGQTILNTTPPPYPVQQGQGEGCLQAGISLLSKCIVAFVGFIAAMTFMTCLFVLISIVYNLIDISIFGTALNSVHMFGSSHWTPLGVITSIIWLIFTLILTGGIVWGASTIIFKVKGATKRTIISLMIIELLLFTVGAVCMQILKHAAVI